MWASFFEGAAAIQNAKPFILLSTFFDKQEYGGCGPPAPVFCVSPWPYRRYTARFCRKKYARRAWLGPNSKERDLHGTSTLPSHPVRTPPQCIQQSAWRGGGGDSQGGCLLSSGFFSTRPGLGFPVAMALRRSKRLRALAEERKRAAETSSRDKFRGVCIKVWLMGIRGSRLY